MHTKRTIHENPSKNPKQKIMKSMTIPMVGVGWISMKNLPSIEKKFV